MTTLGKPARPYLCIAAACAAIQIGVITYTFGVAWGYAALYGNLISLCLGIWIGNLTVAKILRPNSPSKPSPIEK